jgi:hypothetical protein
MTDERKDIGALVDEEIAQAQSEGRHYLEPRGDAKKPKAPPAWMKREPLSRMEAASHMNRIAGLRADEAARAADPDVRAGLQRAVFTLTEARDVLDGAGLAKPGLIERLQQRADDYLACARTVTEPDCRAKFMDDAHAYREAVRHLKGGA